MTSLCAVGVNGLLRRFVRVCAFIAQTQGLHFRTLPSLAFLLIWYLHLCNVFFRTRISRQSAWISIAIIMRRCNERITSRIRKGLCVYFTNSGFAFLNSSIPYLLVDKIPALVQHLFRARISRQCASISIGIIMRLCSKRITSQVRKGLFVYCTNSRFAFANSSIPCLLVHMIFALVQRLFRARISRQCAWISIGIIMRRCNERITSRVRKGLCVYFTNSGFAFLNSSIPYLLVDKIPALVQHLFRARISRQCVWISNGGIVRCRMKRIISQVRKCLCVYCTNWGFAF